MRLFLILFFFGPNHVLHSQLHKTNILHQSCKSSLPSWSSSHSNSNCLQCEVDQVTRVKNRTSRTAGAFSTAASTTLRNSNDPLSSTVKKADLDSNLGPIRRLLIGAWRSSLIGCHDSVSLLPKGQQGPDEHLHHYRE